MRERIVALVDMDCFYVQVEERLNPEMKGKPAAVVQYNTWKGGGIIAVNYEARDRGVTRFMRGDEAKEKCPDILLIRVCEVRGKADLTKYRDAGNEVLEVMCKFCNCVQRASVDEAYLDLTEEVDKRLATEKCPGDLLSSLELPNTFIVGYAEDGCNDEELRARGTGEWLKKLWDPDSDPQDSRLAIGALIVEEMRAAIFKTTSFRCSAGISGNKVLSKLACGLHKPNRQTVLPHSSVPELYSRLPVRKVRSLGGKFGTSLVEELGCKVMGDLARFSENELQRKLDEKIGTWLYYLAQGIENDPVVPRLISKSIGCCKKFPGPKALAKKADVERWMLELASEMGDRLSKDMAENKRRASHLTVHIQQNSANDGSCVSLSRSGTLTSYDPAKISADAIRLIAKTNSSPPASDLWTPPLKFLGLSAGKFIEEDLGQTSSIQRFFVGPRTSGEGTSKAGQSSNQEESKVVLNGQTSGMQRFSVDSRASGEGTSKAGRSSNQEESQVVSNGQASGIQKFLVNSRARGEGTSKAGQSPNQEESKATEASGQKSSIQKFFVNPRTSGEGTSKAGQSSDEAETRTASDETEKCEPSTTPKRVKVSGKRTSAEIDISMACGSSKPDVSSDEDDGLLLGSPQQCPRCPSQIPVALLPEHLDHHIAMDLHAELNSNRNETVTVSVNAADITEEPHVKSVTKVGVKNKRGRGRGASSKVGQVAKVRKIVDFFTPK